jgi:hypothetical protein
MNTVRNLFKLSRLAVLNVAIVSLLTGCGGEPEVRTEPVQLSGRIIVAAGLPADGTVEVRLFHAWALAGELRHPLAEIGSFETVVGEYAHDFDYPVDAGEGLVVYAWLDRDGDGVHCTPTERIDAAGLTEVTDFTPGAVTADVEIVSPCASPGWFYPAPD